MSEIPDDVMEQARAWTSGWQKNGGYSDSHMEAIRVTIARAIMAERKRCAKAALNVAKTFADAGLDAHSIGASRVGEEILSHAEQKEEI